MEDTEVRKKEKKTKTLTLDDGAEIRLKAWKNIDPTLIGSDYNRYEIVKWQSPSSFVAWIKSPCVGMDACDRCAGPHRPKNRFCSQNWNRRPQMPPNRGSGIALMELHTGMVWTGAWQVDVLFQSLGRKSGIALVSM